MLTDSKVKLQKRVGAKFGRQPKHLGYLIIATVILLYDTPYQMLSICPSITTLMFM